MSLILLAEYIQELSTCTESGAPLHVLQQREKELQSRIEQLQVREGGKTLLTARSLTIEV